MLLDTVSDKVLCGERLVNLAKKLHILPKFVHPKPNISLYCILDKFA